MATNPLENLSEEEQEALVELAQARANSEISKRDFLKAAGALGTGAALGGTGVMATAQKARAAPSTSDGDGDLGSPSDRWDVFAEGVDANSVDTPELFSQAKGENIVVVNEGGGTFTAIGRESIISTGSEPVTVIQAALDAAHNTTTSVRSGYVRLVPREDGATWHLGNPNTAADPLIEVPADVGFDIRGCNFVCSADGAAFTRINNGGAVLGHGAYVEVTNLTGDCIQFHTDSGSIGTAKGAYVFGYPTFSDGAPAAVVGIRKTSGSGSISGTYTEVRAKNTTTVSAIDIQSDGTGGYINDNWINIGGKVAGTGGTSDRVIHIRGSQTANWNRIQPVDLQIDGNYETGVYISTGTRNFVRGIIADLQLAATPVEFATGAGTMNAVKAEYFNPGSVNNSGNLQFYGPLQGFGWEPQDLTTVSSNWGGMVAIHDGTDDSVAVPFGPAVWDTSLAAGSGNWRSVVDNTTFGPN